MSERRIGKATNRDLVVDVPCRTATPLTLTIGSPQGFRLRRLPSAATTIAPTARPPRMAIPLYMRRLPFRHAEIVAKGFVSMKVGGGSVHLFAAPRTPLCQSMGAAWIWPALFSDVPALCGTEYLFASSSARAVRPAHKAFMRFVAGAKTVLFFAEVRAISLLGFTFAAIQGVKGLAAEITQKRHIVIPHSHTVARHRPSVEIEERYCEIAAKRLAQEVLSFV